MVHTTECVVTEERFIVASRVYIENHNYKMYNQTTYMYKYIIIGESCKRLVDYVHKSCSVAS